MKTIIGNTHTSFSAPRGCNLLVLESATAEHPGEVEFTGSGSRILIKWRTTSIGGLAHDFRPPDNYEYTPNELIIPMNNGSTTIAFVAEQTDWTKEPVKNHPVAFVYFLLILAAMVVTFFTSTGLRFMIAELALCILFLLSWAFSYIVLPRPIIVGFGMNGAEFLIYSHRHRIHDIERFISSAQAEKTGE